MQYFYWNGQAVAFTPNDTVASALFHHGITQFSDHPNGSGHGVFCGIGQCQSCLVRLENGQRVEACLSPCRSQAKLYAVGHPGATDD